MFGYTSIRIDLLIQGYSCAAVTLFAGGKMTPSCTLGRGAAQFQLGSRLLRMMDYDASGSERFVLVDLEGSAL